MANPKRRTSRSRRGNRRSQQTLTRTQLVRCTHCGSMIRPHTICKACGHYRGQHITLADGAVA